MNRRNIGKLKQLVTIDDLSVDMIRGLINRAIAYKTGETYRFLEPKFVANLFYEDNTKSHYSFEMAQHQLGIKILNFDPKSSSAYKGESLYDAGLTMSELGVHVIVSASQQENYYEKWLENTHFNCALINAGDGDNEDPTHALTDLMTIYEQFGSFDALKVGFVGNVMHSRVTKSTVKALKKLGATCYFAGPIERQCEKCLSQGSYLPVDELLSTVDVVVMLRLQSERKDISNNAEHYFKAFGLTVQRFEQMKSTSIIMHPGPVKRDVEIADALVECSQSKILTQVQNSVYMNMAILEAILA